MGGGAYRFAFVRTYVRLSVRPSVHPSRNFVSRVFQKLFNLHSWNFIEVLITMWNFAPPYFGLRLCYQKWVICPWIVKNEVFKFVSRVTQKLFNLHSWNFIELLMTMWTCAPAYFGFRLCYQKWIICPWIVKNKVFKLVWCITHKPFNLHSWWNFIRISMVM